MNANPDTFQPMNINFGLMPDINLDLKKKTYQRREKKKIQSNTAINSFKDWIKKLIFSFLSRILVICTIINFFTFIDIKVSQSDTATKIDEKVPIITPQIIARAKSDKAPPKKKIINNANNVVTDVITVLESVSLIDLL